MKNILGRGLPVKILFHIHFLLGESPKNQEKQRGPAVLRSADHLSRVSPREPLSWLRWYLRALGPSQERQADLHLQRLQT